MVIKDEFLKQKFAPTSRNGYASSRLLHVKLYRWEDCSWAGINNARLRKLPSLVSPFVPFLISREYNYGRRQLARPFLKIVSLSLSLSNQPRGKYSWEIRRRAVDRRRHEELRLVPGRRFGQSKRQNLKTRQTLWNNDPSHPRLRASPANRGVFNTAWSLGKLRVYANVLSCLLAVCKSLSCKLTRARERAAITLSFFFSFSFRPRNKILRRLYLFIRGRHLETADVLLRRSRD